MRVKEAGQRNVLCVKASRALAFPEKKCHLGKENAHAKAKGFR
jgi:hypothetical protein